MDGIQTIVFVDLAGSTSLYESLGSDVAISVITQVTQWVSRVMQAHDGHVIKFLGDGVVAQFSRPLQAVDACIFMQRNHTERLLKWKPNMRVSLKVGIASGDLIDVGHDTLGDVLNMAARLSSMCGPNTIWAAESVIEQLRQQHGPDFGDSRSHDGPRCRCLGQMRIKGFAQPKNVFQIEWREDNNTDWMTVRGSLPELEETTGQGGHSAPSKVSLRLSWQGMVRVIQPSQTPLSIGRLPGNDFIVNDQRVSRQHAQIDWYDGAFSLSDTSSFGTWLRFNESDGTEITLRRTQCPLYTSGQICMGAPFADEAAPVVNFEIITDE